MADRVKGMPILKKSEFLTSLPSRRRMPMAVMLAEAPMGVMLPPRVAPERRPKYRGVKKYLLQFAAGIFCGVPPLAMASVLPWW